MLIAGISPAFDFWRDDSFISLLIVGAILVLNDTLYEMDSFLGAICFGKGVEIVNQSMSKFIDYSIYGSFCFLFLDG